MKKVLIVSLLLTTSMHAMRHVGFSRRRRLASQAIRTLKVNPRQRFLPKKTKQVALPKPSKKRSAKKYQRALLLCEKLRSFYSSELKREVLLRDHLKRIMEEFPAIFPSGPLQDFFDNFEERTWGTVQHCIEQRRQLKAHGDEPEKAIKRWARRSIKRRRAQQKEAEKEILALKRFLHNE